MQQGHFLVFGFLDVERLIHSAQRRPNPVHTKVGLFSDAPVGDGRIFEQDVEHIPIRVIQWPVQVPVQPVTVELEGGTLLLK